MACFNRGRVVQPLARIQAKGLEAGGIQMDGIQVPRIQVPRIQVLRISGTGEEGTLYTYRIYCMSLIDTIVHPSLVRRRPDP